MNANVMNKPKMDNNGSETSSDSAKSPRRDPNPAKQTDDDPVRFSNIYRMFEAKGAPSKSDKAVPANAEAAMRPPPTNRLKKKKVDVSTMTDMAYDEGDVNDDDILQADDNACGSSTFDQQTEIDDDWLGQGDVNRSVNQKKLNEVTSSTSDCANGSLEGDDLEDDDFSEDVATSQWGRAAGGKVTPKIGAYEVIIPSQEDQLMVGKNRNSTELTTSPAVDRIAQKIKGESVPSKQLGHCKSNAVSQGMKRSEEDYEEIDDAALLDPLDQASKTSRGKSGPGYPSSPEVGFQTEAGRGISVGEDSVGRSQHNWEAVADSDYANVDDLISSQGTHPMNDEQECYMNFGGTPRTVKDDLRSISGNLPSDEKHATQVSPDQAGMETRSHDDRNPGVSGARIKCTGNSGNSYEQVDDPNYTNAKSQNQQTLKTQLQQGYEEVDMCRLRMSESHTGSSSSKASYESVETYENVVPSKSQKITSDAKGYHQNDSTETGNRSATKQGVEKSTGKFESSDEEEKEMDGCSNATLSGTHDHHHQQLNMLFLLKNQEEKEMDEYNNATLSGTHHHHQQQQQQQKFHSAAYDSVSSDSSKESGTRKQVSSSSSSSSSTENAQLRGGDSNTYSLCRPIPQSTYEDDQYNSTVNVKGTVQKRDISRTSSAAGTQLAPKESVRKSMSTNTEAATEYLRAKNCAELECQTDSFNDVSKSNRSVRDQSTDPDEDSLDKYFWYFGDADRELSEAILENMINESGSYLVRRSHRGGEGNPYSISVVYLKRIYHLLIRQRSDGKFSIGKEKHEEKVFFSVPDLITFYQNNFVELIADAAKKTPHGKIQLKTCPRK